MTGRLHNTARTSFPNIRAQVAVLELFAISIWLQYPKAVLQGFVKQHSRRYPMVYSPSVLGVLRCAIAAQGKAGVLFLASFILSLKV
jgi:hypothetical protein